MLIWLYHSLYFVYQFFLFIGLLFYYPIYLSYRKKAKTPLYLRHLKRQKLHARKYWWFHAVSGGEVQLAKRLIELIAYTQPDLGFIVTTQSASGLALAESLFAANDRVVFAKPLPDLQGMISTVITRFQVKKAFIIEHDLWPGFLTAFKKAKLPVYLINADMKPGDRKNYRSLRKLLLPFFSKLSALHCQNEEIASQWREIFKLNYHSPSFNFKYIKKPHHLKIPTTWANPLKNETVLCLASSHEREEEQLLPLLIKWQAKTVSGRILWIPRHPERCKAIIQKYPELRFNLFSKASHPQNDAICLVDQMGYSFSLYQLADICLVGDSFAPGTGGHNILEPLFWPVRVLYGPYMRNYSDIRPSLEEWSAASEVKLQNLEDRLEQYFEVPWDETKKREILEKVNSVYITEEKVREFFEKA